MTPGKKTANSSAAALDQREARRECLDISELEFDAQNPRIRNLLGRAPATQDSIYRILLGGGMDARELVPSFIKNGYLPYEPMVVRVKAHRKYVVMEGNRRLAALRSMSQSHNPEEKEAFDAKGLHQVPCLIFEGTPHQEIAYLGLRHLSKTKDWSSAAKAEFVERALKSGMGVDEAARLTNTTASALRLLLLTRRLFEMASELDIPLPETTAEGEVLFWHLGDAIRRTNTKNYLQIKETDNPLEQPSLDERAFENLVSWIYGNPGRKKARLISSIRDIPDLNQCLGHPKSTEALERGLTIADALEEAQTAGATVSAHLGRAKDSVQRAMRSLSDLTPEGRRAVKESRSALDNALKIFDKAFKD